MKIYILLTIGLMAYMPSKPKVPAPQSSWKEMDQFHVVMAELYHPFKDSANLQPTKMRYQELKKVTDAWVNSPLPGHMNSEKAKLKLQLLANDVARLIEKVAQGTDEEISNSLEQLHKTFHDVQAMWYTHDTNKSHDR